MLQNLHISKKGNQWLIFHHWCCLLFRYVEIKVIDFLCFIFSSCAFFLLYFFIHRLSLFSKILKRVNFFPALSLLFHIWGVWAERGCVLPESPRSASAAPWQPAEPGEGKCFPPLSWRHLVLAKTMSCSLALFHLCCWIISYLIHASGGCEREREALYCPEEMGPFVSYLFRYPLALLLHDHWQKN